MPSFLSFQFSTLGFFSLHAESDPRHHGCPLLRALSREVEDGTRHRRSRPARVDPRGHHQPARPRAHRLLQIFREQAHPGARRRRDDLPEDAHPDPADRDLPADAKARHPLHRPDPELQSDSSHARRGDRDEPADHPHPDDHDELDQSRDPRHRQRVRPRRHRARHHPRHQGGRRDAPRRLRRRQK